MFSAHVIKPKLNTYLGAYEICFSNEFSSYSHKTVYFDLQVGDEPPLIPEMGKQHGALTMMESSSVSVHEALKVVIGIDYTLNFLNWI